MEHYLATERNEVDDICVNLENMLSERHKRSHIVLFHLYEISRVDKPIETESTWISVSKGLRGGSVGEST